MNLMSIAYKSIRQRALASSLTALSVALGVALMVTVLVSYGIIDRMFSQRSIGYDLIVGPKGSELELVLNTVYRVRKANWKLPYEFYLQLKDDPRIDEAIPVALGDFTEEGGFPIVGTIPHYFVVEYAPGRKFKVTPVGANLRRPFDAIIGSRVARQNQWDIGAKFNLVHGGAKSEHVHEEEFEVVGILRQTGTPNDRTVFVHLDGFFMIAGHEENPVEVIGRLIKFYPDRTDELQKLLAKVQRQQEKEAKNGSTHDHSSHFHRVPTWRKEVTAIMLTMKGNTFARVKRSIDLTREMKEGFQAQAVNPIVPMRDLMDLVVKNVSIVLGVMTVLIIIVAGVSVFVSIYNSMADRRKEIAIMRALGARRQTVFSIVLAESTLLCIGGGVIGLLLGHGLIFLAAPVVENMHGILIDPFAFETKELVLLPSLIVLASLVGFIPGMTAYRTDVAKAISD